MATQAEEEFRTEHRVERRPQEEHNVTSLHQSHFSVESREPQPAAYLAWLVSTQDERPAPSAAPSVGQQSRLAQPAGGGGWLGEVLPAGECGGGNARDGGGSRVEGDCGGGAQVLEDGEGDRKEGAGDAGQGVQRHDETGSQDGNRRVAAADVIQT